MLRQYDEEQYSFNETCHALAAILCQDDASKYTAQILKAVGSLCQSWWESDGGIHGDTVRSLFPCQMSLLMILSH